MIHHRHQCLIEKDDDAKKYMIYFSRTEPASGEDRQQGVLPQEGSRSILYRDVCQSEEADSYGQYTHVLKLDKGQ